MSNDDSTPEDDIDLEGGDALAGLEVDPDELPEGEEVDPDAISGDEAAIDADSPTADSTDEVAITDEERLNLEIGRAHV